MSEFIMSCESTIDLPYTYTQEHDLPVLFYSYCVDGKEYPDDMGRTPGMTAKFYGRLSDGKVPTTSQINVAAYLEFFEQQIKTGKDLLHIAFGSGMTTSVNNAFTAAGMLKDSYPDRRIVVVDSLCSSSGYGLLVDYAVTMRDEGSSLDEIYSWLMENRQNVHHQFFSTDLSYYRRSGRVSGAAATIGNMLNICPIMRLDDGGRIIAYSKVRGKRNAIRETVDTMEQHAIDGKDDSGRCFICHSNCWGDAVLLRNAIAERFPKIEGEIRIFDIGTIVASHCGPGTVAAFFRGDKRAPYIQNRNSK